MEGNQRKCKREVGRSHWWWPRWVKGRQEKLVGLLQKKYGYSKDKAEQEFKGFISGYKDEEPRIKK